jgi:uncharacterized repeat protein (TIGR01451 family)
MGVALFPSAAQAHQNPAGCVSNSFDIRIKRDRAVVRVGETVTWTVYASNQGGTPCDITDAKITLTLPGADGNPGSDVRTLSPAVNFPAGSAEHEIGHVSAPLNVNPGVTDAIAQADATGKLHDAPIDHVAVIRKTLGSTIVRPNIEVDKTANIQSGVAPANVTYTFTVFNRSNPPIPLDNVSVSDSLCPGATYVSGDDNRDGRFDPTEVWTYTCSMIHPTPGQYNNTVTACAELILNGTTSKVCDTDTWTVTLTAPPPPAQPGPPPPAPQGSVKPVSANQAPCTLSRASKTTVRAKQLNTIRVRVRGVDAGSKVKLRLPHTKKSITAKTNKKGIATFRVRPKHSGTARIEAAECSDVERLSVKPARKVTAKRAPRVTG